MKHSESRGACGSVLHLTAAVLPLDVCSQQSPAPQPSPLGSGVLPAPWVTSHRVLRGGRAVG